MTKPRRKKRIDNNGSQQRSGNTPKIATNPHLSIQASSTHIIDSSTVKKAWYQKVIEYSGIVVGGIGILGGLLDSISSVPSLLTFKMALGLTAFVLFCFATLQIYLILNPITWVIDNHSALVKWVDLKIYLTVLGGVLLIWLPPILQSDFVTAYFIKCPVEKGSAERPLILVAKFYHSANLIDFEPHKLISDALQTQINKLNLPIVVQNTSETIEVADEEKALSIGKSCNASVLIWGEDTGARIKMSLHNFIEENLKNDFDEALKDSKITKMYFESNTDNSFTKMTDATSSLSMEIQRLTIVTEELPSYVSFLSLYAISQYYLNHKQYNDALATAEAAHKMIGENSGIVGIENLYFTFNFIYEALKQPYKSIDYLKKVTSTPNELRIVAYIALHSKYLLNQESELATALLNEAIGIFTPISSTLTVDQRYALGLLLFQRGAGQTNLVQAINDFTTAIQVMPPAINTFTITAYDSRAKAYQRQGNYPAAIADYNYVIDALTEDRWVAFFLKLPTTQFFSKRIQNSLGMLTIMLQRAYIGRGTTYILSCQSLCPLQKIINDYTLAIKVSPNYISYTTRGKYYQSLGEVELARSDFKLADSLIETRPRNLTIDELNRLLGN